MTSLRLEIRDWVGDAACTSEEVCTLGSLEIRVGRSQVLVTEVQDTFAKAVRSHINVPLSEVAIWLLTNWWRLRWECMHESVVRPIGWAEAHSMAAIGGGHAWPDLRLCSDGEFVLASMFQEAKRDVAAIRFINAVDETVAATDFESEVDRFVDEVIERLRDCRLPVEKYERLRSELNNERVDPKLAATCKRQAMAGIDPGEASDGWLDDMSRLANDIGDQSADEVAAVLPALSDGLQGALSLLADIRRRGSEFDLSWARSQKLAIANGATLPWEKGAAAAIQLRSKLGMVSGPLKNQTLGEFLGGRVPQRSRPGGSGELAGAVAQGGDRRRFKILPTSDRVESQRFYLARVLGCSFCSPADAGYLPVTQASTALQKFERSFAQEFLCPWRELDEMTKAHAISSDRIESAAKHFSVSPLLVASTLVNKGRMPRERLAGYKC